MYDDYTPAQMYVIGRIQEINKMGQDVVDMSRRIRDIEGLEYKRLKDGYFNLIFTEKVFDECKQMALDCAKTQRDQAIKDAESQLSTINPVP